MCAYDRHTKYTKTSAKIMRIDDIFDLDEYRLWKEIVSHKKSKPDFGFGPSFCPGSVGWLFFT